MVKKSIYITSCRRCGTHWLKKMIAEILGLEINLPNMERFEEPKARNYDFAFEVIKKEKESPGGNVYVAHTPLELLFHAKNIVNIIVLVRDLRDACVSDAFFSEKNKKNISADQINELIKKIGKKGGPSPAFNESYISHAKDVSHVLVRFEDLIDNTQGEIIKILKNFNYSFDFNKIETVINDITFGKLSGGRNVGEEDRTSHYRKGLKGEWKNYFSKEDEEEFWQKSGKLMELWGYKR